MLVDSHTLEARGGKGGNGAVAFQKVRLAKGPTGGDGGIGGNVYFEGVADIGALAVIAGRSFIQAKDGKNGRGQFLDGTRGDDAIVKIPIGTTVTNIETGYSQEMTQVGQRILAAGGGIAGRGNFKYRSSTNTTPMQADHGQPGDVASYSLELRLIADVGLVGLPNAGKSSLLNELTAARSKVANYAFTTLEPHLGAYYGLIIADIPGIIEGASGGKGLGVKFLKHVEHTAILFHLISAESDDVVRDYRIIRSELTAFSSTMAAKPEHVFLTKSDSVTPDELKKKTSALKKAKVIATPISIIDEESIKAVKKILNGIAASKTAPTDEK